MSQMYVVGGYCSGPSKFHTEGPQGTSVSGNINGMMSWVKQRIRMGE
jgi:hypothetical protein